MMRFVAAGLPATRLPARPPPGMPPPTPARCASKAAGPPPRHAGGAPGRGRLAPGSPELLASSFTLPIESWRPHFGQPTSCASVSDTFFVTKPRTQPSQKLCPHSSRRYDSRAPVSLPQIPQPGTSSSSPVKSITSALVLEPAAVFVLGTVAAPAREEPAAPAPEPAVGASSSSSLLSSTGASLLVPRPVACTCASSSSSESSDIVVGAITRAVPARGFTARKEQRR
eukprot:scaffold14290_cov63-Phaeocystis_antarctica.AAC.3